MSEAERDECVVMRPDRAIVIRHRVVSLFTRVQGADAPAGKSIAPHQGSGKFAAARSRCYTAEQRVSGVRTADAARFLVTIQRQGIGRDILAPECLFESLAECFWLLIECIRSIQIAECTREFRGESFRCEHISLHFA